MFYFYLIALIFLTILLISESLTLHKKLKKVPVRILVNGTRGKSTMVRLLHDLLSARGKKVYAKVTGDEPVELDPDGKHRRIRRRAPASIIENVRIIRRWSKKNPDVIILECMAIRPEMQRILAKRILKPTHVIFTNILPDHQEDMGLTSEQIARALAESIPAESLLIMNESVAKLSSAIGLVFANQVICENKTYQAHFENIPPEIVNDSWSLLAATAEIFKVEPDQVERCFNRIWSEVNRKLLIREQNRTTEIWNLFSVNDAVTANRFIRHRINNINSGEQYDKIFLINCRTDRPLRTKCFVEMLVSEYPGNEVWLIGDGRSLAARLLRQKQRNHVDLNVLTQKAVLHKLKQLKRDGKIVFYLGNTYKSTSLTNYLR